MKKLNLLLLLLFATINIVVAEPLNDITFMSYNIEGHGISDSRLDNIAKVINFNAPDVVSVQEVDNRNIINMKKDNIGYLAKATNMNYEFHALIGTYYGIALLSKDKPLSVEKRTYEKGANSTDRENRGAIIAEFNDYYFIATHYSLDADDRDTATADIIKFAKSAGKPVFVAGDFNAKPTYRAIVSYKNSGFRILNDINQFTFPSDNATSCIDMFLYYDSTQQFKFDVSESGIAPSNGVNIKDKNVASDHLPIFVSLTNVASAPITISDNDINVKVDTTSVNISGLKELNTSVEIYNVNGSLIDSFYVNNNETHDLNSPISAGAYIVKISNRFQNQNFKLMFN